MKHIVHVLLCLCILTACKERENSFIMYTSNSLEIERVTDNVFKHISYLDTENFGKVPCNGMVYIHKNEAIIFDAPTSDLASTELIKWVQKKQKKQIKAIVITHSHIDCLGGLEEFHQQKVMSFASNLTIKFAKEKSLVVPQKGFDERLEIKLDEKKTITEFFGEGHTMDNVVSYIPSEKVLFGGCLVKGMGAGKGNLADANTGAWPKTIAKIKNDIPNVKIVIPGHGKTGSVDLLDYTLQLFDNN